MLPRSRPGRLAGLALLATPLVAAYAAPVLAAGESTTAILTAPTWGQTKTFTWNYTFHQNGGHALSNLAIAFCSGDILADVESAEPSATIFTEGDVAGGHTGFGPGIKFAVAAPTGSITVTFKSEHPIATGGLQIQSHSGDGQDGDIVESAAGPGPCPAEITDDDGSGNDDGGTTDGGGTDGGTTNDEASSDDDSGSDDGNNGERDDDSGNGGDENSAGETGGDDTGGTGGGTTGGGNPSSPSNPSIVESATLEQSGHPTLVLGETVERGGELPRTGAGGAGMLLTLGVALVTAGAALRTAASRPTRSAFFPG